MSDKLSKDYWITKNKDGHMPLHDAARTVKLDKVPKELLTKENMLVQNKSGITPLHYAARGGQLDQVPKDVLTKENMLLKDKDGTTPLHWAALKGHLDQVPKDILTKYNISISDNYGNTTLHFASGNGHLGQVPKELLTSDVLLVRNLVHESALSSVLFDIECHIDCPIDYRELHAAAELVTDEFYNGFTDDEIRLKAKKIIQAIKDFLPDNPKAFKVYISILD